MVLPPPSNTDLAKGRPARRYWSPTGHDTFTPRGILVIDENEPAAHFGCSGNARVREHPVADFGDRAL